MEGKANEILKLNLYTILMQGSNFITAMVTMVYDKGKIAMDKMKLY